MNHYLSKSKFIKGLQCKKRLYLDKYHKELRDDISQEQEAVFAQGTFVGELATQLFPGGVDMSPENYSDWSGSILKTKESIKAGQKVIYEAAFEFDNVMAALDILVQRDGRWYGYEVKSSTSISQVYLDDAALQYYVIKGSGLILADMSIIYVNTEYTRGEELDLKELFIIESVIDEIQPLVQQVPIEIAQQRKILSLNEIPSVDIGTHCSNPYQCDFTGSCWKHVPDYSIFDISRLNSSKKWQLYEKGILDLNSVPDSFSLSSNQRLQVESEKKGESFIDKPAIANFLENLKYPLFHLDFETVSFAVPKWKGTKPYRQIPFQYSLHIQHNKLQKPEHKEFIADPGADPRLEFIKNLINDCSTEGDVLVYNIAFERTRLMELKKIFPHFEDDLQLIIDRMKDLMEPFRNKSYYTPELRGSYSIKYVLPALVPELSYNNLEIKNGGIASNTYAAMVDGIFVGNIKKTINHLLEYCELDTFAMVKILEKLYQEIDNDNYGQN